MVGAGESVDDGLRTGRDWHGEWHRARRSGWRHPRRDCHAHQRSAEYSIRSGGHGAQGGFVFPNVTADTYTIQVEMPSFRTLRRAGVAVSSGSIIALGTLTLEVGGAAEIVNVTGETPLVQSASGERSFTVSPESVANLPLASRGYEALLALAPGRHGDGWRAESRRAHGRRRRRQLHARWRHGDGPGHQPARHARERRSGGRSEARDVDLSGRVRPVERTADQRRDQERHESVPRVPLLCRARLQVEREPHRPTSSTATRSRSRTSWIGALRSAVPWGVPAARTSSSSTSISSSTRARSATT